MFLPTAVADYRITGDAETRKAALHAANLMAGRFNPQGNYIRALYGFVNRYTHTGKDAYLDTVKKAAHYCIANIPENGIIPIDFRQPAQSALEDSCGACVIAGGLIELAAHVPTAEKE